VENFDITENEQFSNLDCGWCRIQGMCKGCCWSWNALVGARYQNIRVGDWKTIAFGKAQFVK
jgi:hypothetical protein